jgi:hypothetical protein
MKQKENWRVIFALAILLGAFALPRGLALDRVVTPDEVNWLTTSSNFYVAVKQGDFAKTYQLEHPGVTTLWAGAAGFLWRYPDYVDEGPGQVIYSEQEAGLILRSLGHEPLDLIIAGRVFIVLTIIVVLAVAFLQAVPLVGFWPAVIGFLLIAFDPFHIAHSRILHQDGMASSFALLALLAFLKFLYRGARWHNLILSGAAAGLAWLTKSPMFFLIPFMGLLVLIELEKKRRLIGRSERESLRWSVVTLIVWGGVGLAVFVLLWPAMWVDPIYTLRRVGGGMLNYAVHGHTEAPLFFDGQIYTGDPGAHFYPITFLWRTSPVVLIGLVLAVLALILPPARSLLSKHRGPLAMLLLFAGLFTLFMIVGAKKFDRYLLPIYPPLDLVAGVGWVATVNWLRQQKPPWWAQIAAPAILLFAVVGQAAATVSSSPYYFSYYNPLLGGTARAPEVMMVGWGEGLDQAARFLNSQQGADRPQVMLGLWSGTFSYFYDGKIRWSTFASGETTVQDWKDSDYAIIYINQWQRGRLPAELFDYLMKKEPALVVRLQRLDYAYVYDLNQIPPPDYLFAGEATGIETDYRNDGQ